MLTGTQGTSDSQSAQAPRSSPPQGARKPEPNSPEALRFRQSLQEAAGGKQDLHKGLQKDLRKDLKEQADGLAQPAPAMPALLPQDQQPKGVLKFDDKVKTEVANTGQRAEPLANLHSAESTPAASRSVDLTTAGLAAQFAERLALSPVSGGDTQLMLDPSRFSVTQVTISGGAGEDLSFAYESGAGDREGSPDEETLRQRLEARGIRVGSVARKS
jgi:hypothetical protein